VSVIEAIAAERRRQIDVEGWTAEHDDGHGDGSLFKAACCYYRSGTSRDGGSDECPPDWPWENRWWKPKGARRDLIRAGALCRAEIERKEFAWLRRRSSTGAEKRGEVRGPNINLEDALYGRIVAAIQALDRTTPPAGPADTGETTP